MKPECSNCQIGPNGGPAEVGRPDIGCAIELAARLRGIRRVEFPTKHFFCSAYWPYGKKGIENFGPDSYLGDILKGVEDNG